MKTISIRLPDDEYENLQTSTKMLQETYYSKINQSLAIRIILESYYRCNVKSYLSETVKELKNKKRSNLDLKPDNTIWKNWEKE